MFEHEVIRHLNSPLPETKPDSYCESRGFDCQKCPWSHKYKNVIKSCYASYKEEVDNA